MGLFNKIKNVFSKDKEAAKYEEGLTKTRKEFSTELAKLSKKYKNIDDDYFEELENILIMADIGVNTVVKFVDKLKKRVKEENIKDSETLKEIIIDDISFQIIEDIYYTTKNSSVDIKVILNDEKAKYSINGNLNLNTGENTITIIVTAEDESTKEYKFIITKEEDLKSNTNIKAYINEDTINFYNNKATYTVKTDQESVSIECIPDNDNAIINIDNPNPTLNYGDNIINIHITAEDQTTNNYKLTIYRPKPPKEEKSSIIEKIIPPIFLTSIGYIIFKKKKK